MCTAVYYRYHFIDRPQNKIGYSFITKQPPWSVLGQIRL